MREPRRKIDLREFGFVGRVSEKALAEIEANRRRAEKVVTTAHFFLFGGKPHERKVIANLRRLFPKSVPWMFFQ